MASPRADGRNAQGHIGKRLRENQFRAGQSARAIAILSP